MRLVHAVALVVTVGLGILAARYLWVDSTTNGTGKLVVSPTDPTELSESSHLGLTQPPAPLTAVRESGSVESTDVQRLPVAGLRGTVLEARSNRPVSDVIVRLTSGTNVLAQAVSGTDGSFSLPEFDQAGRIIEVVTDEWRISPSSYRLDEGQQVGGTEFLFLAERTLVALLRGTLVDRRTGEPVPEFLLEVRGPRDEGQEAPSHIAQDLDEPPLAFDFHSPPRRTERVVTNADGRFVSEGGFEAGLLELLLVDHPQFFEQAANAVGDDGALHHRHAFDGATPAEEATIQVDIGPTYRFDVLLPRNTSVDDFQAVFSPPAAGLRETHEAIAADPDSPVGRFFSAAFNPDSRDQAAPLRKGEFVWARFRHPIVMMPGAPGKERTQVLHVRSRDGFWSGSATVDSIEGIYPEVVGMSLEARGSIEGIVLDVEGKPVPSVWIQLKLIGPTADASPTREVPVDSKGRFALRWLAEGTYAVIVQSDLYAESRSAVTVVNGSTERLEIRLSSGVHGTVSGRLRSRTGNHRPKGAILSLKGVDNPEFFRVTNATYRRRNREYTGEFAFDGVPSGTYELSLRPLDNMRWSTLTMRVVSPVQGLEFMCEDDTRTFELELRAIDASTNSPIEQTWNIVKRNEPFDQRPLNVDVHTGSYKDVPDGVRLWWVLRAKGYRLATGTESDIHSAAGVRFIEAKLQRGWGQIFNVTTRDEEPIERVELFADGVFVGTTDAKGIVSMDLSAKPSALEFRYRDWVVVWGEVDPSGDQFGWGPQTVVYLGPRDP